MFRADSLADAGAWYAALWGRNGFGSASATTTDFALGGVIAACYAACILLPNASSYENLGKLPIGIKMGLGSLTAIAFMLFSLTSKFLYFNF